MVGQDAADRRPADGGDHDRADEERETPRAVAAGAVLQHVGLRGDEDGGVAEGRQGAPEQQVEHTHRQRRGGEAGRGDAGAPAHQAARPDARAERAEPGLRERDDEHEERDRQPDDQLGRQPALGHPQRADVSGQERPRQFLGEHEDEERHPDLRQRQTTAARRLVLVVPEAVARVERAQPRLRRRQARGPLVGRSKAGGVDLAHQRRPGGVDTLECRFEPAHHRRGGA